MNNTVVVSTSTNEIFITDETGAQTIVTTPDTPTVVTAVTAGPQGPGGEAATRFRDLTDVDITSATNYSLLYFNNATQKIVGDADITTRTVTDGGNF
jgi:hypothetical protein